MLSTWFDVTNEHASGTDNLRWAIDQANGTSGHDYIKIWDSANNFDEIEVGSTALPEITEGVTIFTESGGTVVLDAGSHPGIVVNIAQDNGSNGENDVVFYDLKVFGTGTAFTLGGDELENFSLISCGADSPSGSSGSTNNTRGVDIQLEVDANYGLIYDTELKNKEDGVRLKGHVDLLQIIENDIWAMRTNVSHDPGNPETEPNGIELIGTGTVHIGGNEIYYIGGDGRTALAPGHVYRNRQLRERDLHRRAFVVQFGGVRWDGPDDGYKQPVN